MFGTALGDRRFDTAMAQCSSMSHRVVVAIGYIPPAEAKANYYRQLRNATEGPALT